MGRAWEAVPEPKRQFIFQVVKSDGEVASFRIGPYNPTVSTEDMYLTHRLWLRATQEQGLEKLHHSAIISLALTRLAQEFSRNPENVLKALRDSDTDDKLELGKPFAKDSRPSTKE